MKGAAFFRFLVLAGILAGGVSCGGGGETDVAGIGGTGITSGGTITGFGSVFVNGVKYEVNNATSITVNGESDKTQGDLKIGMVVTVKGTLDADGVTRTASSIVFKNEVKGPVASMDPAACRFEVLGLSITTDSLTVFRDSTGTVIACAEEIANGDVVEVSGFRIGDEAAVRATHVEKKAADVDAQMEVKGRVSNLNSTMKTFTIGSSLVVDFASLPTGVFAEGDFVEVKGALGSDGTLRATSIELEDEGFGADPGDKVELEGIVAGFDPDTGSFKIGSWRVRLDAGTVFKYGDKNTLALPNVRVEVEGTIVDGVLVAAKVEIHREAPYEIKGKVQAASASEGTLTIMDRVITVNSLTQFEDKRKNKVFPFGLKDIHGGDYVEVDALLERDPATDKDKVVAARIEREGPESEDALEGPVDPGSVNDPRFTIMGITVDTAGLGENKFKSERTDGVVGRAKFFAEIAGLPEKVVEVTGKFEDGMIKAEELELEE